MDRNHQKPERAREAERVDELIRRRFGQCETRSLFEAARSPLPPWFSVPSTGRQLHLVESKTIENTDW